MLILMDSTLLLLNPLNSMEYTSAKYSYEFMFIKVDKEQNLLKKISMKSNPLSINIVRYYPNQDPNNFRKLVDAYLKLFNEKENLRFLSLSNLPFDSRTVSSFLKNASAEGVEYYVALSSDEEIVGISVFESDLIKGFQVIGIVVDNSYRFKGLGRALIDKGIYVAKKKGFEALDISVFADNKPMLILLLKMDFKPIRIENHVRFDGEDLIYLKKYL